jgi:hypothetical protein
MNLKSTDKAEKYCQDGFRPGVETKNSSRHIGQKPFPECFIDN